MESQSYQQPPEDNDAGAIGGGGNGGASNKSSFLCRQASSRWIPTTDQIRILRELYYNCGVRSPSAEQIQRISSRLRQYGKIEGKNVFYWFQNHKARERQKKRLTVDIASNKYNSGMLSPGCISLSFCSIWVSPACTSPGVYCVGQVGANGCGGSVLLERNYMEYSLPGGLGGGSMMEGNVGWVAVEPAAMSPLYYHQQRPPCFYEQHQQQPYEQHLQQQQGGGGGGQAVSPPQMETLPLFPIRSEPQRGEEEDYVDGRNHVNSQGWVGKAHPPHNGHFSATFYLDQAQQHQLRQQEEDQRQHCRAYDEDSSINIGGASLELSLYSYGSGLRRGPT
ncbi:hypothetical protein Taro_048871 [Colocasia esculenta]|uniref:Homeobox domain-containing protein n=1 Tax=Colocasia esculenta TaxID=4460 RepID=A0A843X9E0_COLES|nr:hypothetical protein [Colocasia esculenta]